jgi:hypothetical protein
MGDGPKTTEFRKSSGPEQVMHEVAQTNSKLKMMHVAAVAGAGGAGDEKQPPMVQLQQLQAQSRSPIQ